MVTFHFLYFFCCFLNIFFVSKSHFILSILLKKNTSSIAFNTVKCNQQIFLVLPSGKCYSAHAQARRCSYNVCRAGSDK